MIRAVSAAALILAATAACSAFADEPQYVFRVQAVDGADVLLPFAVNTHESGIILSGPFTACADASFDAEVGDAQPELLATIQATGCPTDAAPVAYRYEIIWSALESGSYSLVVEHYGELAANDGVVFEQSVSVP